MKEKIKRLKYALSGVFDDNLKTRQWENAVDYIIIGFIFLSTIQIFLSTYPAIVEKYGDVLHVIDIVTVAFFTVEVSLRIWCADLLDEKYKGFKGRVRYCFTFYGFMDVLSTYPFYLHWIMPLPYALLKVFRIFRVLRIFRYLHSFNLLAKAFKSKRKELLVSLQVLCVITIILSFVLFFVEHEAQPDVYENGLYPVLWAFAQYIGDPGGFADVPPVTFWGRFIACLIGILGIAIFAVPAGLIGSGFTEVMEAEAHDADVRENVGKLERAFERKLDRPSGYQICPRFLSLVEIQARMGMTTDEVVEAATYSDKFRLINLAGTMTLDEHPQDRMAVEHFCVNRSYGCCIDRGSKVTIVSPSNIVDPVVGWFAYYLAMMGGFNFLSRETGEVRPYRSFYTMQEAPGLDEFMDDLKKMSPREDCWVISILASCGGSEPSYPEKLLCYYGAKKGDETFDDPNITLHADSIPLFQRMFDELSEFFGSYGLATGKQKYYANASPKLYCRNLGHLVNALSFRVAWSVMAWDSNAMAIAKGMAQIICDNVEPERLLEEPEMLKKKDIGYRGYEI
jgi:putative ion transport protein